jgi:ribose 5-phosphate isomerase B
MAKEKVYIASDHAGYRHKERLRKHLEGAYDVTDLGTHSEKSCDYPDFAEILARKVAEGNSSGILICGTGIGMSISANKVNGIRAALCCNEDMARTAREHNNANVICLGARVTGADEAERIADAFLSTQFWGEERHRKRVEKIREIEKRSKP